MTSVEDRELLPFGDYPFDNFIMEKWDPSSPLTKKEQQRSLVADWISLGRYGRNVYYQRSINSWDGVVPDHTPQDLLTDDERRMNGANFGVFWIRTWFGTEGEHSDKAEAVTRASADASYLRLYRRAILSLPEGSEETEPLDGEDIQPAVFDDDANLFGVVQHDPEEDVVQPGIVPPFVVGALMRIPDSLDGMSEYDWRNDDQAMVLREERRLLMAQHLLVLVADRKACEHGWVLQIAITHKGQVLPYRVRCKAGDTTSEVNQWTQLGHAIDAGPEHTYTVAYAGSGDGWTEE